ncbi:hypothetical protein [Streptomyces sp. NPDC059092]|uniref:hypothetical protein n=1 Tax=Streptomyces sp. NPDC059092 TaxID=3346725 RepID=UPI0036A77C45
MVRPWEADPSALSGDKLKELEASAPLPEIVVLGNQVLYEVVHTEAGVLDGGIRFADSGLIGRWEGFIKELYEDGEDIISYVDRHVAHLPPPRREGEQKITRSGEGEEDPRSTGTDRQANPGGTRSGLSGSARDVVQAGQVTGDIHFVAEGWWLIALGNAQRALSRYGDALTAYQRSAVLHGRLGDRSREALAWQGAGETYDLLDRPDEGIGFHRAAVAVHRELGDGWNEAVALEGLGSALHHAEAGAPADTAGQHWARALELLAEYDDPRAVAARERVARRLTEAR